MGGWQVFGIVGRVGRTALMGEMGGLVGVRVWLHARVFWGGGM